MMKKKMIMMMMMMIYKDMYNDTCVLGLVSNERRHIGFNWNSESVLVWSVQTQLIADDTRFHQQKWRPLASRDETMTFVGHCQHPASVAM